MQMDESEAAAALLLIVEQSYRDLARSVPEAHDDIGAYRNKHSLFAERASTERNSSAFFSAHRYELSQEKAKRKPGSRQKLSKTSQGTCEIAFSFIQRV